MNVERLVLQKLQPEDFTESFYTKHGISRHAADHCKEMLQLWDNRPAGEILPHLIQVSVAIMFCVLNNFVHCKLWLVNFWLIIDVFNLLQFFYF